SRPSRTTPTTREGTRPVDCVEATISSTRRTVVGNTTLTISSRAGVGMGLPRTCVRVTRSVRGLVVAHSRGGPRGCRGVHHHLRTHHVRGRGFRRGRRGSAWPAALAAGGGLPRAIGGGSPPAH